MRRQALALGEGESQREVEGEGSLDTRVPQTRMYRATENSKKRSKESVC